MAGRAAPFVAALVLVALLGGSSGFSVRPLGAPASSGSMPRACPVQQGITRRATPACRCGVSMGAAKDAAEELQGLLQEGGSRGNVLAIGKALSKANSEPCPTNQASGEYELYAGDGVASRLEGARVIVDWEKGIVQTIEGLTTRVLKILEVKGSEIEVVEVSKRVISVLSVDDPATAPKIKLRVVYFSKGQALVLMGQIEGVPFEAVLKSKDTSRRIKPWDLPGYYEGFLTNDRIKREGDNAAALDNLTPNVKLGVSVTLALTAAVAAFVVANPPPSKDQPLPIRSAVTQAAPSADARAK